ncbi:MAG: hypothetical protein HZB38_13045, partial [Planctomycetes bacterium]|nr:hypothetical protein [Planctomycetota bacterium]
MSRTSWQPRSIIPLCLLLAASVSAQTPLGTAFTYQGQLRQNGQPVFGDANLVFRLYDAATGGTLLGTQTLNGVPVADGLLTVQLNGAGEFGPNALNGEARWLEIEVSGTPLAPRQPVSGAPYALFSSRPWETSATGVFYNAGNVGIGTSAPGALLDVAGAARVSGFNMPTGAGVGRVLKSDGSGNGTWQTDSLTLPFTGTVTSGSAFIITSTAPSNIAGFIMNNAASAAHAIRADSNGAGAALAAVMTGTSHAGYFEVFNSETVNSAVRATSNGNFASAAITATMTGNGKAGYFEILNSNNGSEALYALTNGFGGAIRGDTTGAGDAIFANGLGSGDAVHGAAQGTGRAGSFRITDSSNAREAIFASATGTGIVGEFINLNATNPNPALSAESSGGVAAYFNGDVGMGLTTPEAPLHVQSGSAGAVTANPATILAIENSTGGWISILTPDGT